MSMSGEEWPPRLKPIQESAKHFFMGRYASAIDYETHPSLYPFHGRFPIERYSKFLKEVRESRGYDVTVLAPGSVLFPVTGALLEQGRSLYNQQCEFVVDKINDQAKSLVKVVSLNLLRIKLMTFTVKEVESNDLKTVRACLYCETSRRIHIHGWNFKPDDSPPPSSFDSPPPLSPERQRPPSPKKQKTLWRQKGEGEGERECTLWIQKGEGERTLWSLKGEGECTQWSPKGEREC
ncbi:hypothetical protein C2S51_031617 [Perilla frutescens var. frutescens]|nr:hypothetical protein C2S51_031617 [Perilla frutescens var. frutescens]